MKLKKLLAVVLSVALAVTMIPAFAMAGTSGGEHRINVAGDNIVKLYATKADSYDIIGSAAKDTDVIIMPCVEYGYELTEMYYTVAGKKTTITLNDNMYKFTMPADEVTVSATYEKSQSAAATEVHIGGEVTKNLKKWYSMYKGNNFNAEEYNQIVKYVENWAGQDLSGSKTGELFVSMIWGSYQEQAVKTLNDSVQKYSTLTDAEKTTLNQGIDPDGIGIPINAYSKICEVIATKNLTTIITTCISLQYLLTEYREKVYAAAVPSVEPSTIGSPAGAHLFALFTDYITDDMLDDMSASQSLIGVEKCILNSDVVFKAKAQLIEAFQTKNDMTIISTIMKQYPSIIEEINRCTGADEGIDDIIKSFQTYLRKSGSTDELISTLYGRINALEESIAVLEKEGKATKDELTALKLELNNYKERYVNLFKAAKFNAKAVLGKEGATISWDKLDSDVEGTEIYALDDEGKYELKEMVTGTSATTDIAPEYKLVQFTVIDNQRVSSGEVTVKPTLADTCIKTVKPGKKSFTVTWSKVPAAQQYRIYYKKAGSRAHYKTVKASKSKAAVKGLKGGKTYTVKVRASYAVGDVVAYSAWSKSKKVKVKR